MLSQCVDRELENVYIDHRDKKKLFDNIETKIYIVFASIDQ